VKLTRSEVERAARKLKHTRLSVAQASRELCNVLLDPDDQQAVIDSLEVDHGLFRCDRCLMWLDAGKSHVRKPWLCSYCGEGAKGI